MDILIASHFLLSRGLPTGPRPSWRVRWPARGGPTDCELAGLSTGKLGRRKHLPALSASLDAMVTAAFPVRMDCLGAKRRPVDRCADFPLPAFAQLPKASEPEPRRPFECRGGTPFDNDRPTVPTTAFVLADSNPSSTAWWRAAWCLDPARQNPTLIDIAVRGRDFGYPGTCRPTGCFAERPFGASDAANDNASMTGDRRPNAARLVGYGAHGMLQSRGCCRPAKQAPAVVSTDGSCGDCQNCSSAGGLFGTVMPSRRLSGRANSSNGMAGLASGLPRKLEEKGEQDGSCTHDRFAARRGTFSQVGRGQ